MAIHRQKTGTFPGGNRKGQERYPDAGFCWAFAMLPGLVVGAGLVVLPPGPLYAQDAGSSESDDGTAGQEAKELEKLLVITGAGPAAGDADSEEKPDRFYAAFNASLGFMERSRVDVVDSSVTGGSKPMDWEPGLGYELGGALGLRFGQLRAELELEYSLISAGESVDASVGTRYSSDAMMETYSGWANAYWDIPVRGKLKPFIGAGLGYSLGRMDLDLGGINLGEETDQAFGVQGMIGASYELQKDLFLTAFYKHRFMDNFNFQTPGGNAEMTYGSDSFGLGVRYFFGTSRDLPAPTAAVASVMPETGGSTGGAKMWPPAGGAAPADSGFTDAPDSDSMGLGFGAENSFQDAAPMAPSGGGSAEMEALSRQMAALGRDMARQAEELTRTSPVPPLSPSSSDMAMHNSGTSAGGGSWGVQLASYRDQKHIAKGWLDARRRFSDLLDGTEQRIVHVDIPGKGKFYRLYAGGLGKAEATRVCKSLQMRGQWCSLARLSR